MRALSAIGFVISVIGLLLIAYNQFAVIPFLDELQTSTDFSNDYTVQLRQSNENTLQTLSIISLIIGAFSVLFCSNLYIKKKTRMTFLGIIIGTIVTIFSIIHFLR